MLKVSAKLYPKIAIVKTAYSFLDKAYILLDLDGDDYVLSVTPKVEIENLKETITSELVAQLARYEVYLQTKNVRELMLARAMASTVVGNNETDDKELPDYDVEKINIDWFDKYDK